VATLLVISFSDLGTDPRVDRQIEVLSRRHTIVAAGLRPPAHPVHEYIDISTPPRSTVGRMLGLCRLILRRYDDMYWKHPTNRIVLERLSSVDADLVLANDLATLPIALRLGAPVAFDAHEHAPSEMEERLWWRLLIGPYLRWLCRRYIPEVAAMTTVSEGIADVYAQETGVRARVVLNAPRGHDLAPARVGDRVRVLHHGAAHAGRGLEQMVLLAGLLDERFTVDFVLVEGSPGHKDELIRLAQRNPRVRFPEPWSMREIVERANAYNVGLYLLQPAGFNTRYALPNKFFEFIQARLAVAIGPSPEMARLVERFGCGIVAPDFTPHALARMLNALTSDEIAGYQRSADGAARVLCAAASAEIITETIDEALGSRSRGGAANGERDERCAG
jgi:hypothetical protein